MTSLDQTRRDLIALREAHGADTPIGHRCSNIVELIQKAQGATGDYLARLTFQIQVQTADLKRLTAASQ